MELFEKVERHVERFRKLVRRCESSWDVWFAQSDLSGDDLVYAFREDCLPYALLDGRLRFLEIGDFSNWPKSCVEDFFDRFLGSPDCPVLRLSIQNQTSAGRWTTAEIRRKLAKALRIGGNPRLFDALEVNGWDDPELASALTSLPRLTKLQGSVSSVKDAAALVRTMTCLRKLHVTRFDGHVDRAPDAVCKRLLPELNRLPRFSRLVFGAEIPSQLFSISSTAFAELSFDVRFEHFANERHFSNPAPTGDRRQFNVRLDRAPNVSEEIPCARVRHLLCYGPLDEFERFVALKHVCVATNPIDGSASEKNYGRLACAAFEQLPFLETARFCVLSLVGYRGVVQRLPTQPSAIRITVVLLFDAENGDLRVPGVALCSWKLRVGCSNHARNFLSIHGALGDLFQESDPALHRVPDRLELQILQGARRHQTLEEAFVRLGRVLANSRRLRSVKLKTHGIADLRCSRLETTFLEALKSSSSIQRLRIRHLDAKLLEPPGEFFPRLRFLEASTGASVRRLVKFLKQHPALVLFRSKAPVRTYRNLDRDMPVAKRLPIHSLFELAALQLRTLDLALLPIDPDVADRALRA